MRDKKKVVVIGEAAAAQVGARMAREMIELLKEHSFEVYSQGMVPLIQPEDTLLMLDLPENLKNGGEIKQVKARTGAPDKGVSLQWDSKYTWRK